MLKKFISMFVVLSMFVFMQTSVWAGVLNTDPAAGTDSAMVIDQSDKVAMMDGFQVSDRTGAQMGLGGSVQPWYWILSIFVTGLGQMLMGEVTRGLFFLGSVLLTAVVAPIVSNAIFSGLANNVEGAATTAYNTNTIVNVVLWGIATGIHVWNIVDSYNMNQEKLTVSASPERLAKLQQMEEQVQKIAEIAQNTQIDARDGLTVKYRAVTF